MDKKTTYIDSSAVSLPLDSVGVLEECIVLQKRKARDYQNPYSTVTRADYYPRGVFTIHDIMHAKMLRMKSVMEAMYHDETYKENFESLEDTYKDLINYGSFAVSWLRGKMEGQNPELDMFNNKKQHSKHYYDINRNK